jgi:hypothetical protein
LITDHEVVAFVDWNAQIHGFDCLKLNNADDRASRTLNLTVRSISKLLASRDPDSRFRVSLRLYHGWHKGYEPTDNRKAIIAAVAAADFSSISRSRNVIIRPDVSYGDRLLDALDSRLHVQLGIHLPNTLREQGPDRLNEKMVDSALATDLLSWARLPDSDWAVVMCDDDDLVPPVFVAEAWTKQQGGRVLLARHGTPRQGLLRLEGLLVEIRR